MTTLGHVLDIQYELYALGLYRGKLDGINGPKTIEAIKKFQRLHPPLSVDGICGQATLKELFPEKIEERNIRDGFSIPSELNVQRVYGMPGRHQTRIQLPYTMKLAWDESVTIDSFKCHQLVSDKMHRIFETTLDVYGIDEIRKLGLDLFGGCLNVRKMRGGNRYSMHSWGIAVDLDPARNQLRWGSDKAQFAKSEYNVFWDIVEDCGAVSLGREKNYDWMHFQFAKL